MEYSTWTPAHKRILFCILTHFKEVDCQRTFPEGSEAVVVILVVVGVLGSPPTKTKKQTTSTSHLPMTKKKHGLNDQEGDLPFILVLNILHNYSNCKCVKMLPPMK